MLHTSMELRVLHVQLAMLEAAGTISATKVRLSSCGFLTCLKYTFVRTPICFLISLKENGLVLVVYNIYPVDSPPSTKNMI